MQAFFKGPVSHSRTDRRRVIVSSAHLRGPEFFVRSFTVLDLPAVGVFITLGLSFECRGGVKRKPMFRCSGLWACSTQGVVCKVTPL